MLKLTDVFVVARLRATLQVLAKTVRLQARPLSLLRFLLLCLSLTVQDRFDLSVVEVSIFELDHVEDVLCHKNAFSGIVLGI